MALMKFKNSRINAFWKFSTSFQLGIPILVALTILIIAGTIVESKFDAYTASQLVYRSWMMYVVMVLLIYNLTVVMVDRLPWKKNHYPFVLVHIGIIVIILGGWVTQKFGIDGSISLPLNGQSRYVTVGDTDLVVYGTFDGNSYRKLSDQEVDFFNHPPSVDNPHTITLPDGKKIRLVDYVRYGRVSKKTIDSTDIQAGASVKLQLTNANVKQVETLTQPSQTKSVSQQVGPLSVHMGEPLPIVQRKNASKNEAYFQFIGPDSVKYQLFDKNTDKPYQMGQIKVGDVVKTHWMNLEIRLLDLKPKAKEVWDVIPAPRPTPLTSSAVLVDYNDKKEWLLLNDRILLFNDNMAYLVGYINRRIDIGFDIKLNKFEIQRYQGSMKAMQYASDVQALDTEKNVLASHLISMNEPMKYGGFYLYQSSFEQDPMTGEPTASVLSVNKDPGRSTKYIGSLILSLGIIWLFYQKRKRRTAV